MRVKITRLSLIKSCILLLLIFSCTDRSEIPELPQSISMYPNATEKSFEYSDPITIDWETLAYPNLNTLSTTKFNMDNIEGKPFDLSLPVPLQKFSDSVSYDFTALPSETFDISDWPEIELNITTKRLGKPEILDAGTLSSQPGLSRGVLELGEAFGISEQLNGLYEDNEGMLWFGGVNNLYKYDYDKLYKYGIAQGLNFTRLLRLIKDEGDRLWLGSDNSLLIIDFKLNLSYKISNLPAGQVNVIQPLNDGQVVIGLFGIGYYFIDLEDNIMRKFGLEQGLLDADFLVATPLEENQRLWLGSGGGINILDLKTNTNTKITDESGLPNNNVSLLFQDLKGRVWISTVAGNIVFSKDFDKKYSFFRNDIGLSSSYQENDSIIWLGATNGVLGRINDEQSTAIAYELKPGRNHVIYSLLISKQGQLWASKVVNSGVFVMDLNGPNPGNYSDDDGLVNKRVWATLPMEDGNIWIGTYEGINVYNSKTQRIKHLGQKEGLAHPRNTKLTRIDDDFIWSTNRSQDISIINTLNQTISDFSARFMEDDDGIATVYQSKSGIIWIGSNNGYIYKLNPSQQSLHSFKLPIAQAGRNIDNILENDEGAIFFNVDFHGVYKLSMDFKSFSKLNPSDSALIEQVYSMDFDNDFNLWLGAFTGVHKINFKKQSITTYSTDQGLPSNDTYVIKCDDGKTYAGTSQGLIVIKESEENNTQFKIKTIDRNKGLRYLDFAQNSLSIDPQGRIWAGVEDEILTVMDPITMDTTNIETVITGIDIYDKALHFNAAYSSEVSWIGNDTIWSTDNSTYTLRNEFESNNNQYSFTDIDPAYNLPKDLKLSADQNYLSFSYHRPQFDNPQNLKYSYILEGIDKVWSAPTNDTHSENYRDLPAGDYTFKVTALGPNNTWSKPSEFSFSIIPPWWQTLWARLLFFILFVGLLWSIIWYRGRWLKEENRLLEEKVSHRTRQLKSKIDELKSTQNQLIQSEKMASLGELTAGIAHEIQNPLNFVNNFSEINQELIAEMHEEIQAGNFEEALLIANDIKDNEQKIYHHGKRADSIVKGMLQHSRNHSGEKLPTDINALCDEYLRLAYHGLRAKDKSFNAHLESEFDDALKKIMIVPQDIGRVVLNIINNALYAIKDKKIKHNDESYKPTVKVITEKVDDKALIKIRDNGNGIPAKVRDKIFQPFFTTKAAGDGTGLGLSMSYDIIKAHGGELRVESKEGEGTTFTIELPIS